MVPVGKLGIRWFEGCWGDWKKMSWADWNRLNPSLQNPSHDTQFELSSDFFECVSHNSYKETNTLTGIVAKLD
jgi:hypothetical protein